MFNGDELGRRGVCAGLAAIWMNLHCAVPDAKISTRMLTLASREGMHHALIYQRLYSLNHDCSTQDLFDPELIGSEAYRQVNEESLRSIDSIESEAHDQIDAIYGISRDNLPLKSTISASKMAGAMATIDGYASLNYRRIHSDKTCSGHEMSMYRSSGNGIITFFEPNYGEFKFRTEAAAQFLRELRERARDENDTYFKWTLTRVRPNIAGMSTPVDVLVDRIKARYAARLVP
ncbi:C58 family peptidase [Xanthomonas campestris pv. pennamericanum]|nr:C58 family peptidase [Xanthomonas campestris pv. pennamericanum]